MWFEINHKRPSRENWNTRIARESVIQSLPRASPRILLLEVRRQATCMARDQREQGHGVGYCHSDDPQPEKYPIGIHSLLSSSLFAPFAILWVFCWLFFHPFSHLSLLALSLCIISSLIILSSP